ncbi:RNA helicase [Xylographa carneopallida]|nr:RNA helicase [Xylographa carneopallida]
MRTPDARASVCLFCAFRSRKSPCSFLPRKYSTPYNRTFRLKWGSLERPSPRPPKRDDSETVHSGFRRLDVRPKNNTRYRPGQQLQRATRGRVADADLIKLTIERLEHFFEQSNDPSFVVKTGLNANKATPHFAKFKSDLLRSFDEYSGSRKRHVPPPILGVLRQAYTENGESGIDAQLKFALQGFVANSTFTKSDILNQVRLADLRYPYEWYPATRAIQRKIHLHVGPTNSGKTYHALKRLEAASSGIYAGPLRLLAHEVYSRLNALGKPCNLITGDERIKVEGEEVSMSSCTVEMVPVNRNVEVAVVDEIQMIGNDHRGWAWTQAVLGLKAQELHLCGEERAVPLIRELAAAMGDHLEIHHYERLSPLRPMSTSLNGDLRKLRKGDCLVVFSRVQIHAYRKDIESLTGKRVAVVYGSLPPEIRAQQAKLFNDPDNDYDFLVASDAIGMGLNLSIKRIIFESTSRHNGEQLKTLEVPDIKQIAGRAGRYRTAADAAKDIIMEGSADSDAKNSIAVAVPAIPGTNLGLVTTLERMDLPIVQRAMQSEAGPITTAGIFPPDSIILKFSKYFPSETPFSYILLRLHEIARVHSRFHLCNLRAYIGTADLIQQVKDLTVADRISLCAAPVDTKDPGAHSIILAFARCIATQRGGNLLDIHELNLEILDQPVTTDREYLKQLESLHKSVVLYLWLSYRFIGVFPSQAMAFRVKGLTEAKIDKVLTEISLNKNFKDHLKKLKEQAILKAFQTQAGLAENGMQLSESTAMPVLELEDEMASLGLTHIPQNVSQGFPAG